MTTLELDADSIVYKVAFSAEGMEETEDFALQLLDLELKEIITKSTCDKCNIYLGTYSNFRKSLATIAEYKGNRKKAKRPEYYSLLRKHLVEKHKAILVKDQEAEDAVGIAAYKHKSFDDFVIGAVDKDLDMLAGYRYNYNKKDLYFIDPVSALRSFYVQVVTGDSTDNIPGLYKLLLFLSRDAQAKKFKYSRYKTKLIKRLDEVSTEKEMYNIVMSIYKENVDITLSVYKHIMEIARLVWIRRYEDEVWQRPGMRDFDYITNENRSTKSCGQQ